MKPVEQALFTSVEADGHSGYQVVAASGGVCAADEQELAAWGPAHDSMFDLGPDAESFCFHPLPSGAYGIARTTPAGWEYGGGRRTCTHCLIVPPEVLARFANNPLAVIQAASQHGFWQDPSRPCSRLEPRALPGGAVPVDQALLGRLAVNPGPQQMAALIQAARDAVCLAVVGACPPASLIAGLFSCLPPECRLEFSFSTGLKFSPRRPFRIVALSDDPAEQRWVAGHSNVTVLELGASGAAHSIPVDGWARLIERTLALGEISFLATQMSKRRFDLTLDDLPALGLQLLESLDAAEFRDDSPSGEMSAERPLIRAGCAHAAHGQFAKSVKPAATTLPAAAPAMDSGLHPPEVLEKLEHLDDLVYEAIRGHVSSLDQLRIVWPKLLDELGEEALAESREQYLRYALSIWEECANAGEVRNPNGAIHALDVLCLLFENAT